MVLEIFFFLGGGGSLCAVLSYIRELYFFK